MLHRLCMTTSMRSRQITHYEGRFQNCRFIIWSFGQLFYQITYLVTNPKRTVARFIISPRSNEFYVFPVNGKQFHLSIINTVLKFWHKNVFIRSKKYLLAVTFITLYIKEQVQIEFAFNLLIVLLLNYIQSLDMSLTSIISLFQKSTLMRKELTIFMVDNWLSKTTIRTFPTSQISIEIYLIPT